MPRFLTRALLGLALLGLAAATRAVELPGPVVDAAWVARHLPDLQVLEVRSDVASFTRQPVFETDKKSPKKLLSDVGGHLPGARLVDFKLVRADRQVGERKLKYLLPEKAEFQARMQGVGVQAGRPIVLVPAGQDIADVDEALRLYWTFKVYGEDRVAVLDGGAAGWLAEGREFSVAPVAPATGNWQAGTERPQLVAGTADVLAAGSSVQLVDGRPLPQFHGLTKRDYVGAHGHIAGAQVLAPELLTRSVNGALYFLPARTYEALLRASRIDPTAPAIAYCNSGHLAAGPWFVMSEIVGNRQTRLYDGSLYLWTLDKQPLVGLP
ncbi:MAG: sulfurtransferase [Burkholderiales bacterium]|nr:sulfurtransferase [Burkholderiales bacterium]